MAQPRLPMRKIKEILRLHFQACLSARKIARSCSVSRSTVADYLSRARVANLDWTQVQQMSEAELERCLLALPAVQDPNRPQPDFPQIHQELRGKSVTLQLLWQEYKQIHPDGYQYSQFCERYRQWRKQLDVVLRQNHRAGEKMFVDYAGQSVDVIDPKTGEASDGHIFVAVLGASNYTYAEATARQDLASWIGAHVRALEFFGGSTRVVVPDNPRTSVKQACYYEPELNPTYADWARHYSVAVLPARPRAPRDKAKVESAVLIVERWILAAIRKHRFFSLGELNQTIARLLEQLNQRPFQKLDGNRLELYRRLDQPALQPLPVTRYQLAHWKKARVNIDYHIELERHFYSVPYALIQRAVEIRFTGSSVEIFHRGERVASHRRSYRRGQATTCPEHRPKCHRRYLQWSPSRLITWASKIGPHCGALVEKMLAARRYPEQAYRSCLGLLRLGTTFGEQRLEAACERALSFGSTSYKSVKLILSKGLDSQPLPEPQPQQPALQHCNLRGAGYFTEDQDDAD